MKDRIWDLLILRINQEERTGEYEKEVRYLAGCYAVYTAAAAVLSALYPTGSWHVLLTLLAILLGMFTVILCVNPFGQRLQLIRRDLAELEAMHAQAGTEDADEKEIQSRLQLIAASGAGVSAQERRAYERVKDRSEKWQAAWEGRPARPMRLFGYEKFLYWFWDISRIILLTAALLLPIVGFVLAACGLL